MASLLLLHSKGHGVKLSYIQSQRKMVPACWRRVMHLYSQRKIGSNHTIMGINSLNVRERGSMGSSRISSITCC